MFSSSTSSLVMIHFSIRQLVRRDMNCIDIILFPDVDFYLLLTLKFKYKLRCDVKTKETTYLTYQNVS